jgi:hypothetical protein
MFCLVTTVGYAKTFRLLTICSCLRKCVQKSFIPSALKKFFNHYSTSNSIHYIKCYNEVYLRKPETYVKTCIALLHYKSVNLSKNATNCK